MIQQVFTESLPDPGSIMDRACQNTGHQSAAVVEVKEEMLSGQPGESEAFPEEVVGPVCVPPGKVGVSPGRRNFRKKESTCKVQGAWEEHDVFRGW